MTRFLGYTIDSIEQNFFSTWREHGEDFPGFRSDSNQSLDCCLGGRVHLGTAYSFHPCGALLQHDILRNWRHLESLDKPVKISAQVKRELWWQDLANLTRGLSWTPTAGCECLEMWSPSGRSSSTGLLVKDESQEVFQLEGAQGGDFSWAFYLFICQGDSMCKFFWTIWQQCIMKWESEKQSPVSPSISNSILGRTLGLWQLSTWKEVGINRRTTKVYHHKLTAWFLMASWRACLSSSFLPFWPARKISYQGP